MPTMQNAKCKVQNEGVAFGDLFQSVPKEHRNFAFVIYHFALCASTINPNYSTKHK